MQFSKILHNFLKNWNVFNSMKYDIYIHKSHQHANFDSNNPTTLCFMPCSRFRDLGDRPHCFGPSLCIVKLGSVLVDCGFHNTNRRNDSTWLSAPTIHQFIQAMKTMAWPINFLHIFNRARSPFRPIRKSASGRGTPTCFPSIHLEMSTCVNADKNCVTHISREG